MAEEKKSSASSDKTKTVAKKSNKTIYCIIGGVVLAIMVVLTVVFFVMGSNRNNAEPEDKGSAAESGLTEDEQDDKEENATPDMKTLLKDSISLKYDANKWKMETNVGSESVGLSRKNTKKELYVLLSHTSNSNAGLTTQEYADLVTEGYEDQGLSVRKKPTAVKVNGKDWVRAVYYGDGAWMDAYFYAQGKDYYLFSVASESDITTESKEVQDLIDTITVK